jgi:DNA excision repair protein ERCC-1
LQRDAIDFPRVSYISAVMADEIEDSVSTSIGETGSTTTLSAVPSNGRLSGQTARPGPALDRAPNNGPQKPGVVQPRPQPLAKRAGPSSIIVSPRQKGNPLLNGIKQVPWEYGDIVPDYILGVTTCALFLSLKYHRLHPEYIYTRIKQLQGKYSLRIVLVMVDIGNHEHPLKELSKTSLINNVTLVLCWSSAEGGRYLELFKSFENASPTAIKQHQSTSYSDRMVDFITTPRSVNKTDAVSLVSQFGSIRTAVNARHEDVAGIAGWGDKKVERWCTSVTEPFRIKRAAKRGLSTETTLASQVVSRAQTLSRHVPRAETESPLSMEAALGSSILTTRPAQVSGDLPNSDADRRAPVRLAKQVTMDDDVDDEEALADALKPVPVPPAKALETEEDTPAKKRKPDDDPLSDGVMAALSKLRKT